ncbi:uncharacterized protein TrAFT101_004193 [Trichoderma asperellum]|uniref:uncharacterized protein n=1 Tax=Trichoderma asperellum TaxID=101201 RepID=UPI00331B505E|nr:hypothetical protein TrAFT101_004193 [Trichoderma asperellum]
MKLASNGGDGITAVHQYSIKHFWTTHLRARLEAGKRPGLYAKGRSIDTRAMMTMDRLLPRNAASALNLHLGYMPLRQVHAAFPLLQMPVKIRSKLLIVAFCWAAPFAIAADANPTSSIIFATWSPSC